MDNSVEVVGKARVDQEPAEEGLHDISTPEFSTLEFSTPDFSTYGPVFFCWFFHASFSVWAVKKETSYWCKHVFSFPVEKEIKTNNCQINWPKYIRNIIDRLIKNWTMGLKNSWSKSLSWPWGWRVHGWKVWGWKFWGWNVKQPEEYSWRRMGAWCELKRNQFLTEVVIFFWKCHSFLGLKLKCKLVLH